MSSPTINVPANLLEGVVGFVEVASLATKRAMDEVGVHRQSQTKAASLRPQVLEHLVKLDVVPAAHKAAADAMLGAHDTTLTLLKAAADKIAELNAENAKLRGGVKAAGDLGSGIDARELGSSGGPSSSDFNSLTHPIVGEKHAYVRESDKALMRAAGIAIT